MRWGDTQQTADDPERGPAMDVDRRRMLAALSTMGALALAGCTGDGDATTTTAPAGTTTTAQTTTTEPMETTTTTDEPMQTTTQQQQQIDPRFGYTAVSPDQTPPVEPDHTVELIIEERENVPVPEFFFEPTGLFVEPGDTVKFNFATPHHNVIAYHPAFGYTQRVPDDVPPFSSPVLTGGDYWLYTFEEEGVHDFNCSPHEYFGMAGRIVVGSASGPGANPVGEAPGGEQARSPALTGGLVLSDPVMTPDNIVSEGSVSWRDLADESKRLLIQFVEE